MILFVLYKLYTEETFWSERTHNDCITDVIHRGESKGNDPRLKLLTMAWARE